jgi:two-component system, cell cycle response regulator
MRVLIAEDDFASRILLDAVLLKWGYEVVPANDGEAALQILQGETAPPIAILDWMMPKLSGVDVCQLARRQTRELVPYILMLTAKGQKTDISQGLDAGADDYLVKPFDLVELGARLRVARRAIALQSALLDSQRTVRYQALHDVSTGALNRGAILTALAESLQPGARVTVTLYAINEHKARQEHEGVPSAEAAVRGVVQRLRACLPDARIGRYGPDELLVVETGKDDAEALAVATRVRAEVGNHLFARDHGAVAPIGLSAGVVTWDAQASLELLLCYADAALYAARSAGVGAGVEVFELAVGERID